MSRQQYNLGPTSRRRENDEKEDDSESSGTPMVIFVLLFLGLMGAFIGVSIYYGKRLDDSSNTNGNQQQLLERLQMLLGDANNTNGNQQDLIEQLQMLLDDANATNGNQQGLIDALIAANETQHEQIDQLFLDLSILQSQFALFLNQLMNGTSGGGGGGGMMMTLPPAGPGSSYVNFNSTPFLISPSAQANCCIGLSSGRIDIYTFDYLNRGQAVGDANVTQTILQNYFAVAFRMVDGLRIPSGAYNVDFFIDVTRLSGGGSASFFVAWIPTTWWNTPYGIDTAIPPAPGAPTHANLPNAIGITNSIANIPMTNPAGTQAAYMSINNFFLSTGVESLFIMARMNPMGGGSTFQINSFQVNFNKL